MATKTFKIGLSNTDKQNMAQAVYERLLDLTFAEYNTTTQYKVGDFVVYNDTLYQCIAQTSGAWDSTKWEQATLQDLLDDVENAVASVGDKANVYGEYPGMTVGKSLSAKAIDNISEDSGAVQETPFIDQGTGTANGSTSVDTSPVGKQLEKQGNTVVVNEVIKNNFFNSTSDWSTNSNEKCTLGASNNVATVTIVTPDSANRIQQNYTFISGHKYYVSVDFYGSKQSKISVLLGGVYLVQSETNGANKWNNYSGIVSASGQYFRLYVDSGEDLVANDTVQIRNVIVVDLTQWFGSNDNIPQDLLDNPSNFFRYYNGSLACNEGTLATCYGQYLVCGGRNVFDEEWELGGIDGSTGQNSTSTTTIRSKNYIKVIPNAEYQYKAPYYCNIRYYDTNKNYLGYAVWATDPHYSIPSNVCYIRFVLPTEYGTTYNNDITISLYYTTGDSYDQYYPYEQPKVYETGNEILRSAGSVKDYKTPDGTVHRLIGVVDLGTINFSSFSSSNKLIYVSFPLAKAPANNDIKPNMLCSKYVIDTRNAIGYTEPYDIKSRIGIDASGYLFIQDENFTQVGIQASLSGVYLYYELAEPTTEQGTPFSENIEINDYGTMGWLDDNNDYVEIPQGCKIFYPADYVLFLDSLGEYSDWAAEKLALKTDLPTEPETYLKSISGYDATKTQTLKNVNGTFTWVDD